MLVGDGFWSHEKIVVYYYGDGKIGMEGAKMGHYVQW